MWNGRSFPPSTRPYQRFDPKISPASISGGEIIFLILFGNQKQNMKPKIVNILRNLTAAGLACCFVQGAFAQDSHWSGLGTGSLWSDLNNWTPVGVPPSGNPTTPYAGNVWLDAANGVSVITIPAGAVETPGVGNATEVYNTIFGPEWGVTLNVYGSLTYDWLLFPVQNNPNAPRSYINLHDNAVVSTSGAALGLGDSWFYSAAPYVTMNLYSNAQYSSLGGAGLWLGGHINIYDNAFFLVNGYINADFNAYQNDGTRAINVGGGTLILPEGYTNGANSSYNGGPGDVHDFIARGILRAYGKGFDTNDLVFSDNGTNAFVTPVPLGGAMQRVYFQSLPHANVSVGTFMQATLAGDYPSVSGVLLSSSEPGLNPSAFPAPVYSSSNPHAVAVDKNGRLTAISAGTATITATVGAFTSTNSLTVTVLAAPTLVHEYKFNESSGTTTADSVPGNSPTWDGTLVGGATLGSGQVTLDGSSGYVQLPAGLVSGLDEVTIETWASFGSPVNTWADLYAFGDSDLAGNGANYLSLQPHTGGATTSANFGIGDPGNAAEIDAASGSPLDGLVNVQVVAVYHPGAGTVSLYTNGVLAAVNSTLFNNLTDPVVFAGPTYNRQSIVSQTLGTDNINYLGHSLYSADPTLNASLNEFRIYNGALTAAQINADYALGPNQLLGTSTNVSLTATASGGNLVIKWPTSSALVTLMSSPTLGTNAVWTQMNGVLTTDGSGHYQMTVPATVAAQYFRLQQ
jgi:hypothetical protein